MKVQDIFSIIFDNEKNNKRRDKYDVIRTIIEKKLVDDDDFGNVIKNHDNVVKQLSWHMDIMDDVIEMFLITIYNYPQVYAKYEDILADYKVDHETSDEDEDDETNTDEDDETSSDEDEEDTKTNSKNDEKIVVVDESAPVKFSRRIDITLSVSIISLCVSIFNTALLMKNLS